MTVISPADVTKARTQKVVTVEPTLNIVPLVEIASATITAAPSYPMAALSVSPLAGWSSVTDVVSVGRAFSIEDTNGRILTWGVQRLIATSDTFYCDAKSLGDGGYATNIMRAIPVNSILRVYRHRPAWAYLSRATTAGGLKYWDVAYFGSGSTPQPVCNMGTHRQAFVASESDVASFTLDSAGSFDWLLGTDGIAERLWILPEEATITDGDTGSTAITIMLPPGAHEVGCRVTSANGQLLFGWRWIFVNVRAVGHDHAAFSDRHPVVNVSGDTSATDGRQVTFEISGDLKAALYPGALCVFTTRYRYNGEEIAGDTKTFVGYLEEMSITGELGRKRTTATFLGPLRMAGRLPTATQLLEETLTPVDWTQVRPGLSHPAYALHYLLIYHATLCFNHDLDYEPFVVTMRRLAYGFGSDVIGSQIKLLADIATCIIGCRSDGTITLFRVPEWLQLADKNALDTKYTWTDRDIAGPIQVQPEMRPPAAYVILDGVSYDGATVRPYRAIAPGYAQMQGVSKQDGTDIIIPQGVGDEQAYLNKLVGQQAAYENNPLKTMQIVAASMLDIWEPADNDWHALDVADGYLPISPIRFLLNWEDEGFRFRPEKVSRNWSNRNGVWTCRISATCRALSDGTEGVFLPTDPDGESDQTDDDGWPDDDGGGGGDDDGTNPPGPDDDGDGDEDHPGDGDSEQDGGGFDPDEDDFDPDGTGQTGDDSELYDLDNYRFVVAHNDLGRLARSANWLAPHCDWQRLDTALTGKVMAAGWDYQGTTNPPLYVVTHDTDANLLRVYHCANIKAPTLSWTETTTISVDASNFLGLPGHVAVKNSGSMTAVAWLSKDAIRVRRRSVFYIWGSTTVVNSSAYTDDEIGKTRLDLDIEPDGDVLYITGMSDNGRYKLYKATGSTGSFSEITGMPSTNNEALAASPMIRRRDDRVYLVANKEVVTPGAATKTGWTATSDYNGTPPTYYIASDQPGIEDINAYYGYDVLLQTDELRDGATYTVDGLTFEWATEVWYDSLDGDPPGNSGAPAFFPPNDDGDTSRWSTDFRVTVNLLDAAFNVLWGSGDIAHNTLEPATGRTLTYAPSPAGFNRIKVTRTGSASTTFATAIEGVAYIRVRFISTRPRDIGTITPAVGVTVPELTILTSAFSTSITEIEDAGRRLYRVTDVPAWTDISPLNASVPSHPLGLGKRGDHLTMIAETPQGVRELWQSGDDGDTWTKLTRTTYRWVKRYTAEGIHILAGPGQLAMTLNNFGTVYDRLGKWGTQVGQPLGNIEQLLTEAEWKAGAGKV